MLMLLVAGRATTRDLNIFQILEIRACIGVALLFPLIQTAGGVKVLKTHRVFEHLSRSVAQYAAQCLWFLALTLIPVAQVVSIEFTMPIWTAVLAVIFLGETLSVRTVTAIALGVVGVAIVVRPEFNEATSGQLVMLAAAVAISISVVLTKSLTRTDHVLAITFWTLVGQCLLGFIPAAHVWQWPAPSLWAWLFVVAFCGAFSQYCLSQAVRHVDATVVVSIDFLRVPLSALLGWLMFSERLDAYTLLGAVLILTGSLLNVKRTP